MFLFFPMRRERDSNSRTSFAGHTLSRRASSATRASLPFRARSCELCLNFALFGYKNIFFFLYSHSFCAKSFNLCAFFVVLNVLLWVNTRKYTFCVAVCDVFDLFFAYIINLCDFSQHFYHISALVSLPPMGNRSQVWGIGFEHNAV